MVHHNGLPFPVELERVLRDNGLMRRNRGKKNKRRQAVHIEVTPEALLLIDLGNIFLKLANIQVIEIALV